VTPSGELIGKNGADQHSDRRMHRRLNLRWPVLLYRKTAALPVSARTENISGGGFFFVSAEPFTPSERLRACILLPQVDRNGYNCSCLVECEVEVVHVGVDRQTGFGTGCRIDGYAFRKDVATQRHEVVASNRS
jgi:PilZ domain